jgi:hypothetical protein
MDNQPDGMDPPLITLIMDAIAILGMALSYSKLRSGASGEDGCIWRAAIESKRICIMPYALFGRLYEDFALNYRMALLSLPHRVSIRFLMRDG